MEQSVVSKKALLVVFMCSMGITALLYLYYQSSDSTKIAYCYTGKKLTVYLRVKNKIDILVNPENNQSLIQCLGKYIPFYDKRLELVVLGGDTSINDLDIILQRFEVVKTLDKKSFYSRAEKTLRLTPETYITTFNSPIDGIVNGIKYGLAYQEGNDVVVISSSTQIPAKFATEKIDILLILEPLSTNGLLNSFRFTSVKEVILMKKTGDREVYMKWLTNVFNQAMIKEITKNENGSFIIGN